MRFTLKTENVVKICKLMLWNSYLIKITSLIWPETRSVNRPIADTILRPRNNQLKPKIQLSPVMNNQYFTNCKRDVDNIPDIIIINQRDTLWAELERTQFKLKSSLRQWTLCTFLKCWDNTYIIFETIDLRTTARAIESRRLLESIIRQKQCSSFYMKRYSSASPL